MYIFAVLRDMIQDGTIVVYMDDIIIPAKDIVEGIRKLDLVLRRAASGGLKIKWQKSQILRKRVNFLGYVIEDGSITPSEDKIVSVKNYPMPTNRKAVERF